VEKRLVKKVPFKYTYDRDMTVLSPDPGISRVGAKIDARTGALMYEYYEEWVKREMAEKKEREERSILFSEESNAVINFEESEIAEIDQQGETISHRVEGAFRVINRSTSDRLWDVYVELDEVSATTLPQDMIKIKEIEPGRTYKLDYLLKKEDISLALEELFIISEDYPNPSSIPMGEALPVEIHLGLKNLTPVKMVDVEVEKLLPGEISNLTTFGGEEDEEVNLEGGKLLWRLNEIGPGEIKILKMTGEIVLKEKDEVEMGRTNVSARAPEKISGVVVKDFGGLCKNMYVVEMSETDVPGTWQCQLTYRNPSAFSVKLERVEVLDAKTREIYLALENMEEVVPPKGVWKSDTWTVENQEKPAFLKNIQFRVIPSLSQEYSFRLTRRGLILKPAHLIYSKSADRKEIASYRPSRLTLTVDIKNGASATFREVLLRESIPEGAVPPKIDEITILKNGSPSPGIKLWMNYDEEKGEMLLKVGAIPGGLRPEEILQVRYPVVISRPAPEEIYSFPTDVVGLPVERGPPVTGKLLGAHPSVNVTLVVKKMAVGKAIEPSGEPGEYKIELFYFNEGNSPVTGVVLRDLLPVNFQLKAASHDPAIKELVSGEKLLEWHFESIAPGEKVRVEYIIKGEGEYSPSDAQIFYNAQ